ncbi:hypothetical protein NDU88_004304 [Pleurodeles waltl]|uniref:Uncharacterized protein n=1 Tax=Pleurodeles waltl TaxID=8319 RepID=A0AAV7T9C3_PLEWA|nr:hypothetical protein NDU88_004304 [Pleurodeles waltl]
MAHQMEEDCSPAKPSGPGHRLWSQTEGCRGALLRNAAAAREPLAARLEKASVCPAALQPSLRSRAGEREETRPTSREHCGEIWSHPLKARS